MVNWKQISAISVLTEVRLLRMLATSMAITRWLKEVLSCLVLRMILRMMMLRMANRRT